MYLAFIALVILVFIYLAWRFSRPTRPMLREEKTRTDRQDWSRPGPKAYRRPAEQPDKSKDDRRGDLVVVHTPEHDNDTEVADEITWDIPEAIIDFARYPEFGEDKCVLIARDNETLFSYWEVTFLSIDRYARTTRDGARPRIVLRVYNAEDKSDMPWHTDIEVNSRLGTYYLPLPITSRAFYAEIGLVGSFGFWPIARSGIAEVPLSVFGDLKVISEYERRARSGVGISSR